MRTIFGLVFFNLTTDLYSRKPAHREGVGYTRFVEMADGRVGRGLFKRDTNYATNTYFASLMKDNVILEITLHREQ